MRYVLSLFMILTALSASAQAVVVPQSTRPVFPDDYTASACAPSSCDTFVAEDFRGAAFRFLGLSVDAGWFQSHHEEMLKVLEPLCLKRNTCLGTPGNAHMFCDDLITPSMRNVCDSKYPKEKDAHAWEQCKSWVEVFALGMAQQTLPTWRKAQACAKPGAVMHSEEPEIWMAPERIPAGYPGYLTIFALDRESHVPVYGHIIWDGQIIFAPANPTGETATYYPFKGPIKLMRVPNAEGHMDVVPPTVTVKFDYYPSMQYRLPIVVSRLKLFVQTDPNFKKPGKHTLTVTALDADTEKPVEAQVMLGERTIGQTNTPLTIERGAKEKFPELWVTSEFDLYSDTVVAPAEK
jgi:hypothetical protein